MNHRLCLLISATACLPTVAFAQFPHFNAVQISAVPTTPAQNPVASGALTNSMRACGYQSMTVSTGTGTTVQSRPFAWTLPTSSVNIGLPPGFGPFTGAQAKWINDSGTVLVFASQFSPTSLFGNFVYNTGTSTWTQIVPPTGAPSASFTVQFVTDAGEIVGYYTGTGTIVPHRWPSPTAASVQLPTPVPSLNGRQGTPIAVNRTGQVLMTYIPASAQNRVYVVGPGNTIQRILQSPAHMPTTENVGGMNDQGVVVGWSGTSNTVPTEQRGFVWDTSGVPTQLFEPVGMFQIPRDINNAGWIVGSGYTSRAGNIYSGSVGKLYLPGLGTTNLTPLVNAGQLPAGASIESANNVNDSGQILVTITGGSTGNPYYILTPDNNCPLISQHPPATLNLCNTGDFTLTAGGYAATPVSYLWRRNSQPLLNQTGPVLTITGGTSADNGLYDCVVSNTCGNAVTTPCAVTIVFRCGPADLGAQGGIVAACGDGQLDNNDFIAFIDLFFTGNPLADMGVQGGIPGVDGAFDNNDFIVFIDLFFAGC